jgi:hypothetical protein
MSSMDYEKINVCPETRRLLRIVAAVQSETMAETVKRLVQAEYDRVVPLAKKEKSSGV